MEKLAAETLPAGFAVRAPGITDDSGSLSCGPTIAGTTSFSCTLSSNAAIGVHTITVPVTAPACYPPATSATYTNSATLSGGTGSTIVGANPATDMLEVTGCVNPKLVLSKSNDAPSPLASGGTFNWTVKATISDGPTLAAATIVARSAMTPQPRTSSVMSSPAVVEPQ